MRFESLDASQSDSPSAAAAITINGCSMLSTSVSPVYCAPESLMTVPSERRSAA